MDILYRIYNILRAIINYTLTISYVIFIPVKENKYFCMSMLGNNFGDSVKCLADYISKIECDAIIVWGFTDSYYAIGCPYKKVRLYSLKYYYHILTSKYIIVNQGINHKTLIKRKGQVIVQTWHGTALKKIGSDIKKKEEEKHLIDKWFRPNAEAYYVGITDIWISGSRFMSKIYKEKFLFQKPIYEVGTPRNDIFFSNNNDIVKKVKSILGISGDEKIVFYAPTFRADGKLTYYDIDSCVFLRSVERELGGKYRFMIRLHPLLLKANKEFSKIFPEDTINASYYPDMQELLCASDILITDYSSSIFDFMYSYKPIFLYLPDMDAYSNSRGFYFDIETLPFIKINNNKEIGIAIGNFDEIHYKENITKFIEQIGSVESGHATELTYDLIKGQNNQCNYYC